MTGFVLYDYGPLGWIEPTLANSVTRLAVIDLFLALCVAVGFMIKDAREQGISVAPYLAITILAGSAGPLAYLIRRLAAVKANTPPVPRR